MRQHRQIHVWISDSDYLMLHELSAEEQESVSAILRRLIKSERHRLQDLRVPALEAPQAPRAQALDRPQGPPATALQ